MNGIKQNQKPYFIIINCLTCHWCIPRKDILRYFHPRTVGEQLLGGDHSHRPNCSKILFRWRISFKLHLFTKIYHDIKTYLRCNCWEKWIVIEFVNHFITYLIFRKVSTVCRYNWLIAIMGGCSKDKN